jgi:hypothetical protein
MSALIQVRLVARGDAYMTSRNSFVKFDVIDVERICNRTRFSSSSIPTTTVSGEWDSPSPTAPRSTSIDLAAERDSIMKLPQGAARAEALRAWALPRNGVPLFVPRVYMGRDLVKSAVINLSDPNGKPRLRLAVDSLGAASVEFLDRAGRVMSRLPQ